MKLHNTMMLLGIEPYRTKKDAAYARVLLMVPGTTEALSFLAEDLNMLSAQVGTLWDCIFDYSEKYQRLRLAEITPSGEKAQSKPDKANA